MNIIEMIEKYESLQEEYNNAEEKALEYESKYMEMANIGYSEEDSYTHSMATTWSSYENKMKKIDDMQQQYDITNNRIVAKQLIREFNTIEINTLINELNDWFNAYGNRIEVFTQPSFFMHDKTLSYDDMVIYNYIDDFKWNINKNEYFIVKENDIIKSYNQKDFFKWLKNELQKYEWWDGYVTEELETIIAIIHPNYYFF